MVFLMESVWLDKQQLLLTLPRCQQHCSTTAWLLSYVAVCSVVLSYC